MILKKQNVITKISFSVSSPLFLENITEHWLGDSVIKPINRINDSKLGLFIDKVVNNLFLMKKSLVIYYSFANIGHLDWLDGRVVMQRTATPLTPVRFRLQPPIIY